MSAVGAYRNNRWGMTASDRDGVGFGGYGDFTPKILADAAIAELGAELVERDRMLDDAEFRVLHVLPMLSGTTKKLIRKVFADIRARAEEGIEDEKGS